jgi:hypothetical protein
MKGSNQYISIAPQTTYVRGANEAFTSLLHSEEICLRRELFSAISQHLFLENSCCHFLFTNYTIPSSLLEKSNTRERESYVHVVQTSATLETTYGRPKIAPRAADVRYGVNGNMS